MYFLILIDASPHLSGLSRSPYPRKIGLAIRMFSYYLRGSVGDIEI